MVGGAPLAQTNGFFIALAANALEAVADPGAVLRFTPDVPAGRVPDSGEPDQPETCWRICRCIAANAAALQRQSGFLGAPSTGVRDSISKIPSIVSFGNFIDETSTHADLICLTMRRLNPGSIACRSRVLCKRSSILRRPLFPLHNTRAMADVLLGLAQKLGGERQGLPYSSYDPVLRAAYVPCEFAVVPSTRKPTTTSGTPRRPKAAGGAAHPRPPVGERCRLAPQSKNPWHGAGVLLAPRPIFLSISSPTFRSQFGDGSLAHLPWIQELPDVFSSAMWSSWVKIHPTNSERWEFSRAIWWKSHRRREAAGSGDPLPGDCPDMVAMPVGQGHEIWPVCQRPRSQPVRDSHAAD